MGQASKHTQESGGCGRGPELGLKLLTPNLAHLKVSKAIKFKLPYILYVCMYVHPAAVVQGICWFLMYVCLNDMGTAEQHAVGFCCLILF